MSPSGSAAWEFRGSLAVVPSLAARVWLLPRGRTCPRLWSPSARGRLFCSTCSQTARSPWDTCQCLCRRRRAFCGTSCAAPCASARGPSIRPSWCRPRSRLGWFRAFKIGGNEIQLAQFKISNEIKRDHYLKLLAKARFLFESSVSSAWYQVANVVQPISECHRRVRRKRAGHFDWSSRPIREAVHERHDVCDIVSEVFSVDRCTDAKPRVVWQTRTAEVQVTGLFDAVSQVHAHWTCVERRSHQLESLPGVVSSGQDSSRRWEFSN